jgi:hypothetical protein
MKKGGEMESKRYEKKRMEKKAEKQKRVGGGGEESIHKSN